jgi:predicted aminopeptidase
VRVRWGGIGLILLGIVAGTALVVAVTPMGRYLAHGAWAEARILKRRQSIARLVADNTTPAAVRAKLQLVLEARRFAEDSLGLPAKSAFTQFTQLDRDTLVLVLSGAERDRLAPVTWWFPIVGRVPYKGYFDFEEARREEVDLRAAGFDAYLRPSPAFSTLGFFNDPLLSTTLGEDSVSVVETVIHELTHNRIYMKGHAVFNESFASFVGARGTIEFFRARGDTASVRRQEARWSDDLLLGRAWEMAYRSLDSAFHANPGDSARGTRLAARDTVYSRVRRFLVDSVGPRFRSIDGRYAERVRLDNAALLARRIYATGLQDFEAVFERSGRRTRPALERVVTAAREAPGDPGAAISLLTSPSASPRPRSPEP